jgi:hypothetical protein
VGLFDSGALNGIPFFYGTANVWTPAAAVRFRASISRVHVWARAAQTSLACACITCAHAGPAPPERRPRRASMWGLLEPETFARTLKNHYKHTQHSDTLATYVGTHMQHLDKHICNIRRKKQMKH